VTQVSDPLVPLGNVISQDPAAGTSVNAGTAVDLVISTGPATVDVPDVVGLPQATAEADIQAAGLVVGAITLVGDPVVPAGNVISQDPLAGTMVSEGTAVDLVVSLGLVSVDVPDVVGLPQAAAEADIQTAGLVVGTVSQANDPVVPVGNVISQAPAAGTTVNSGSAVDLVVSIGPVPVQVSVEWIRVRESISTNTFEAIIYKIFNNDTTSVTGTATLSGTDGSFFTESFTNLAPGTSDRVVERWTSPSTPQTVDWTLTVTVDGVVVDTLTASTVVQ
jgi:beta-lactam-binding protein with PASTA domain